MKKNLLEYLDKLHMVGTEEEVIECLNSIIKGFNVKSYKDVLMTNPYFRSLILDIKVDIIAEMIDMKEKIKLEIESLNKELSNTNKTEDFIKFKQLKRDCISLLNELENRQTDLYLLS
jgi:hypothetical protein